MADRLEKSEHKEQVSSSPQRQAESGPKTPAGLGDKRQEIAGALAEGQEGEATGAERVSEVAAESAERKGDGVKSGGKKDDGKKGDDGDQGDDATFIFDENNLPAAPMMIKKIEAKLRKEINGLQKQARKYQGGLFSKPNYPKYSETVIEIRRKNVILKRLVSLAADALKKLFIQMFKPKPKEAK